jgi:peptidoglycan/LPS O-acetylase OafA/YrhL
MKTGQDQESGRVVALDLLRGLAAFAVMIPHYFMYHLGNAGAFAEAISIVAVEVFFVLSGFVLGPQIVLCATRRDWATLRTFLVRRWMRTIPSYLIALLAVSIIFKELGTADFFRYVAYVQNLFAQYNEHDYYPVAWSLSVEEWYYVVFPIVLLAFGLGSWGGRSVWRQSLIAALCFIIVITLLRTVFGSSDNWGAAVRRVVVFRIDSIAYGFVLYLFVSRATPAWNLMGRWAALLAFLMTTAVLLYVDVALLGNDSSPGLRHLHPFASAAFGMSTVIFFLSLEAQVTSWRMNSISAYVGHLSYPIYLFHLAVLFGLARLVPEQHVLVGFGLYVGGTVLIAAVIHYAFEQPILAARPRYRVGSRKTPSALVQPGE